MFDTIYNFFMAWLFNGSAVLSSNDMHIACVFLSVIVTCWVLYIAIIPIKAIISAVFRGW
jgi:thiosulfate reductase cytochrome b subunit